MQVCRWRNKHQLCRFIKADVCEIKITNDAQVSVSRFVVQSCSYLLFILLKLHALNFLEDWSTQIDDMNVNYGMQLYHYIPCVSNVLDVTLFVPDRVFVFKLCAGCPSLLWMYLFVCVFWQEFQAQMHVGYMWFIMNVTCSVSEVSSSGVNEPR